MREKNDKPPFEVYKYSLDQLLSILSSHPEASIERIKSKDNITYFDDYCSNNGINIKTLLVEYSYVDQSYLEDYANYYVRCFPDYPRLCTRIHFFTADFSKEDFLSLLGGEDKLITEQHLKNNYKGFVVVRPLPETVIGRSCLATYPTNGSRRFPILRKYYVNLFGIPLSIDSLAFQEQDKAVAVCATSALWSIFHGTGMLFHHPIPSPVEITKKATRYSTPETRTLIQDGLDSRQISTAIRDVGLEPFAVDLSNPELPNEIIMKRAIYAYSKIGIPIFLGFSLVDSKQNTFEGRHAVAVTGYNSNDNYKSSNDYENGFYTTASSIDKLYVHDDQIGPFARMCFDGVGVDYNATIPLVEVNECGCAIGKVLKSKKAKSLSISTSWRGGSLRASPQIIIIPLYHKIRISYLQIYDAVRYFNGFLMRCNSSPAGAVFPEKLKWDIYLSDVGSLKNEIRSDNNWKPNEKMYFLTNSLPKYIWVAKGRATDGPIIDIFFDATDIPTGNFVCGMNIFQEEHTEVLNVIVNSDAVYKTYDGKGCDKILSYIRQIS